MGGLVFNSFKTPNGKIAGIGHLSFDRFNDNQVMALEYNENKSGVRSGMSFYDRPGDGSLKKSLDLVEEANLKTTSPERLKQINATFKETSKKINLARNVFLLAARMKRHSLNLKIRKERLRGDFLLIAMAKQNWSS